MPMMVASPCAMMLPPNMMAMAQAPYRNISLARSGLTPTSVPFTCQETAWRGHTSTQAPHFMHEINASPFSMDSFVSDMFGQAFRQRTQVWHLSLSILTSNTLILLKRDWNAPNGHRNEHCVLFLVRNGRKITRTANRTMKIAF